MCRSGDTIILNSGSTAFLLGQEIADKDVHIATNYYPLLKFLLDNHKRAMVSVIGEQFYPERNLFLMNDLHQTRNYAGRYMFTSGSGLTAQGLYKADLVSLLAEQKLIDQVQTLVCLVDSDKIGKDYGSLFVPSNRINLVITGKTADAKVVAQLRAQGVEVILV